MRKTALLLAIAMLISFVLCSCSEKKNEEKPEINTDENGENADTENEPEKEQEPEKEKEKESEKEQDSEKTVYDNSKFINEKTITFFCNSNESLISDPANVKGIIIEFPGLGGSSCLGGSVNMNGNYTTDFTALCAANGIIVAYLFPGPWSWGNKAAVNMADDLIAALAKKYDLPEGFPIAACGGSMGGLGCLIYSADSRYDITAVASACPCTDVIKDFRASDSFPRTFVSAVAGYDMPLEDALKSISPIERIDDMHDIPYFICSDGADEVFPENECNRYVDKLKEKGFDVTYHKQPALKHGEFADHVIAGLHEFLIKNIVNSAK